MHDHEPQYNQERWRLRNIFRFDALLFVFLVLGWSLIFVTATVALQRVNESWLPLSLVPESSADYSTDPSDLPKLAQVKPQIIEAVRQDERIREQLDESPDPTLAASLPVTTTPTISPTPTLTPSPGNLVVSAGGPYIEDEGSPVILTASGFNSALNILPRGVTYRWDLDGDGLYDDAEGISTETVFYDEGDYAVAVQASDLLGRVAIDLTRAMINNVPPLVDLGPDRTANEGEEIIFFADVSDPGRDILLYEWDFGDSSPMVDGTLQPTHIYRDNGEYTVRLRVNDNDGGLTEASLIVSVDNLPPLVDAGPDQVVNEGELITFSGTASDPADPPGDLSYAWDFDYDGQTFTPDASGETASTVYDDGPAQVVAALRVEDEDGGETITSVNVTVNNVAPVITRVTNDGPAGEGSPVNLTAEATDVGDDTLTYEWDFDYDGLNFNVDITEALGSVSNIWNNQGNHTVGIRVGDGDGGQALTTMVVSTYNLTPTAIVQVLTSLPVNEGSPVNFDGSESYDPGNDPLTFLWDFGDGRTSTEENPVHIYADDGTYNVTLTVTDDSRAIGLASVSVTVLNVKPTVDAGPDRTVDEGAAVTYTGNVIDPGSTDVLTYTWDFNDDGLADATGNPVTWIYPDGGPDDQPTIYKVTLRVQDSDAGEAMDTFDVTVRNLPPTADAHGPYAADENQEVVLTGTGQDVPADMDTLIYEWDFDYDGTFSDPPDATGPTVRKVWGKFGVYTVGLRVTDKDEAKSSVDTTTVHINAPPVVNPGGAYSGLEGGVVTFTGIISDDDNSLNYTWSFGDGNSKSGTIQKSAITATVVVTNSYSDNGVYTSTLSVTDSDNSTTQARTLVTIHNVNPVVNAGPDRTVEEGIPFTLNGSATEPGTNDTLSYAWDFNYDGITFDVDSTGQMALWAAPDGPAVVTVALRVRDDDYPYPTTNGGQIGETIDTLVVTVTNVAPVAIPGGPYNGVEGDPIILTGEARDVEADVPTYAWDFDYDGTFDNPPDGVSRTVSNIWNTGGVYTVALRVTDKDGASGLATARVNVNSRPIADAGGPYSGNEGSVVTFNGGGSSDPDGDPLSYTWNFGDGSPAKTGITATHIYADSGNYTVNLTVADNRNGVANDTASVTINNLPPTAVAAANPNPVFEGKDVTFNGSASTDPGTGDTLSYEWNFGDGSPTANGASVTHSYGDNGNYTATLTVHDGDGGVDTTSISVVVMNENPQQVNAGGPYFTTEGIPVTLTGNGSDVPADTLSFAWDFDYDGANFNADATGPTVTYTWPTPGSRTVAFRVSDDDGGFTIATTAADVGSRPTANPGGPYSGNEGSAIAFDGSGSSDADGDDLSYTWDFGDGSPTASGATVSHTYIDNGDYTVTLQVDDGRGGVDSASTTVTVNNVAPTAVAGANPNPAPEGTAISFDASGSSDPGSLDNLAYTWNFGDGGPTANGANVTYTYQDNGTYTVTLTVTDKDGATGTATLTIDVTNAGPEAVINVNPNPSSEEDAVTFDGSSSSDPGANDTLSYAWDFGDGSPTANGESVTHTYADNGDYTVTLTVTDKDGANDTTTVTLTVENRPPTADAGGPYSTTADTPVQLTGSGSDVAADTLTYHWDLDDDGAFESDGETVTFTQAATGTYTVRLEVRDDDGGSATATTTVEVNSIFPFIWLGLPGFLRRRKRYLMSRNFPRVKLSFRTGSND